MKTFRGGIHLHDNKLSGSQKIEDAVLPPKVIIPLQQHIGIPAQPVVEVGSEVKKGQKIGEAAGFVSAMIHASISGKVIEIADYLYPNPLGLKVASVVIESNGSDDWSEDIKPFNSTNLNGQEILDAIREAGIVGMGGASFPTNVKLSIPEGKKIDSIIVNGVECEPYTTSDHRLMVEEPAKVINGLKLIMKALNLDSSIIGIEVNKPDAISAIREAIGNQTGIKIVPLKIKYPQGWENMIIKAILKKEVPPGGLPLDVGAIVSNVGTVAAISDAIHFGYPLVERIASVTGSGIVRPRNLRVRIGTPFSDLIEQCGGFKGDVRKVIAGGPMMGFAMFDMDVPVTKGTSNILALSDQDAKIFEPRSCIKCGRCVSACPVRLMPTMIASLAQRGKFEEAEEYNPLDCKECGCCTYICPAKIPLGHLIQVAKADIIARQRAARARASRGR